MTIDVNSLKFYAAVATAGGSIDLSNEETSGVVGNEISKITSSERSTGTTRYVKQFLRNENGDVWAGVRVYLSARTQLSPKTDIAFALTGTKSMLESASTLSGTGTVTATGWISTTADLRQELFPGEMIYNSTNDTLQQAQRVESVGSSYIKLEAGYYGTLGSGVGLSVAPATMALFISPVSIDDPVSPLVDIQSMGICGVWKRYLVWDGCPQFTNDWFTLTFEED